MSAPRFHSDRTAAVLFFLFAWSVIAIVAATTAFIALGASRVGEWIAILGIMLRYFYTWGVISVALYWLVNGHAMRRVRLTLQVPMHLGLLLLLTLALPFLIHPQTWERWLYGDRAAGFHALNAFVYAFTLLGMMLWRFYGDGRERAAAAQSAMLRQMVLERSLDRARMETLRAQVNPHFLFNTLNSIAALIESSNNREAYRVIELLAELLRSSLEHARDALVTLRDELGFVEAYLAIEKIRYAERLRVVRSIADDCLSLSIPSFSLQPLVENVVKHGVAKSAIPVTIVIEARRTQSMLSISVTDDGPGFDSATNEGTGLDNLRDRLRHLFGGAARLHSHANAAGGATVTISLPVRKEIPPAAKRRFNPAESGASVARSTNELRGLRWRQEDLDLQGPH